MSIGMVTIVKYEVPVIMRRNLTYVAHLYNVITNAEFTSTSVNPYPKMAGKPRIPDNRL